MARVLLLLFVVGTVVLWVFTAVELNWAVARGQVHDQNVTTDVSRNFFTFGWLMVATVAMPSHAFCAHLVVVNLIDAVSGVQQLQLPCSNVYCRLS